MSGAQSFIRFGRAQTDLDMNNFKLLNLDTSNLPPSGIPPTIVPPLHNWLNGWDAGALEWSFDQPEFNDIRGFLNRTQSEAIGIVGIIRSGQWRATPIDPLFVPRLDQIQAPTANLSLNNKRITNLADPVDDQDAVNRRFMDFMLQGLNPKEAVRCALTVRGSVSGLGIVDGVQLVEGDRILVTFWRGVEEKQNGIYIAHTGLWTRSDDADSGDDLSRAYCFVLEGDDNGGTSWVEVLPIVDVGVDPVKFLLFSRGGIGVLAGDGLDLFGNTLNVLGTPGRIAVNGTVDIDPTYEGQTSIETLGTVNLGTWEADIISPEFGGTGKDNGVNTCELEVVFKVGNPTVAVGAGLELKVTANSSVFVPITGILATQAGVEKLTNKRKTPRVSLTATTSSLVADPTLYDAMIIQALGTAVNVTTGLTEPDENEEITLWIRDNGTPRAITWDPIFVTDPTMSLPSTTELGLWTYARFVYNKVSSQYILVNKLDGSLQPSACDTSFHSEIVAIRSIDATPSLEALATTNRSVNCTLISIVIVVGGSREEQRWQLRSGTADPLDPGQLQPADYTLSTPKFWEKVG